MKDKTPSSARKTEAEALLTLARSLRLDNNYSLLENLEKMGNSDLPSFDLFREERAKRKQERQTLIDKLHVVMGGLSEGVEEARDLDKVSRHIDVPIEFLGGRLMSVDPEVIKIANPSRLLSLDNLTGFHLDSEEEVKGNPLAMALLNDENEMDGDSGLLMDSLKTTPLWKLGKMAEVEDFDPQLMSLRAGDLSAVFRAYLYKNNVKVGSIMSDEAFDRANMRDAFADLLVESGIEQSELVNFLSHGSTRLVPKKVLIEKYTKSMMTDEQFEAFEQDYSILRKDIQAVRKLAHRNRAKISLKCVDRVLENFEKMVSVKKKKNPKLNEAQLGKKHPLDVSGLTEGLSPLERFTFLRKVAVYRYVRGGSHVRVKQYLLMLRLAETEQERELCLRKLRKEYILFDRYQFLPKNDPTTAKKLDLSWTFPDEKDSLFRLFIDAVARQMEESLVSSNLSKDPVANLIESILERDSNHSDLDLCSEDFQEMLSTYLKKGMGFKDKHVRGDDSSENLLASKEVLEKIVSKNMMNQKKTSVRDFIFKLNVAMGGFWNRKRPDGNGKIKYSLYCFEI